jgi:hypothetical protein
MKRFVKLPAILLFILAFATVLDLFLFPGRSITFDGHIHITTFAQFARALSDGEFPVRWSDGFAQYGHPLPLFAHQTTSYLGGLLTLLLGSPVLAYNTLFLCSAFFSSWLLYRFLLKLVKPESALLGAALFSVAPYRLVNIFIRGALPEFFSLIFIPWLLLGVFQFINEKRWIGLVNIIVATSLLALTHPMLLILTGILVVPITMLWTWPWMKNWRMWLGVGIAAILAVATASTYILPLLYDIRFTNYGAAGPQFSGNFLMVHDLLSEHWAYFGTQHPGPRHETLVPGLPELLIFVLASIFFLLNKKKSDALILSGTGILVLLLLLPISEPLYRLVPFLSNVQFPWRMLSVFLFLPPILLAVFTQQQKKYFWMVAVLVAGIVIWRLPQAYGKNYMVYDEQHFFFTRANLHTNNLNTIWMGDPTEYPAQEARFQIIEGEGEILSENRKNASREYTTSATTPLKIVEHTFYFPGWKVYVDGQEVPIEFQDPNYRGLITFSIPEGQHSIILRFEDTKIRVLGSVITVGSGVFAVGFLLLERKYRWLTKK